MDATQTAPHDHLEFDRLCERVDDFEHLPHVSPAPLERTPAEPGEETELNQLILAGLVSPV